MNEFLLVFRRDFKTKEIQPSPEEFQTHLRRWRDWLRSLESEEKLARAPQPWEAKGVVLKHDKSVTDGPYAEIKESLGGFIIIKAANYEEAVEIAKGAPILDLGGTVEIRMAVI
ncbi:YciI family protein [Chitinophaga filiformis]|uniref:YCII-related domain-containing protein n=1 Tax=Chitinophaga filiformis TaxID=104663 RepID=A0A1G7H3N0_CHIFI|nr:YciI family protein [Chitinophaga filiformis]SDE94961.1 YCII-related domain-containing protein [Chitinophaga filiformis]